MDRRRFMALGGLAAASPALTRVVGSDTPARASIAPSHRVNFTTDGLGLGTAEYAAQLFEASTTRNIVADNYSIGGSIAELERTFAALLGKEAAMFVPTGTLANHLAVRTLAGNDRRVLVQAESHFYNDSGDCAQVLSGLNLIPLAQGRSTITLAEVQQWVERSAGGRVETRVGAISIENPVRRRDHEMVEFGELERLCRYAREKGIRLHLDGARMFNLPLHSGKSVRDYAALFDTVYVSLWKHFNGASGAIVAGEATFIDGLFHTRRMFGGSLPHAWPQVALVSRYVDGYEQEYAKAWRAADQLIDLLQSRDRFGVRKVANGTSRFFLTPTGKTPERLAERALTRGVVLPSLPSGAREFPMQVNPTILRMPVESLARILVDALKG